MLKRINGVLDTKARALVGAPDDTVDDRCLDEEQVWMLVDEGRSQVRAEADDEGM